MSTSFDSGPEHCIGIIIGPKQNRRFFPMGRARCVRLIFKCLPVLLFSCLLLSARIFFRLPLVLGQVFCYTVSNPANGPGMTLGDSHARTQRHLFTAPGGGKWLSMMYPRLFLAKNLLRDDGVIFISIDDHEVHNLRLLMDEIFGEENQLGVLI